MHVPPIRPKQGGRRWNELLAIGPAGELSNEVFLDAKHWMKCGGVMISTGEKVPGLAANVILDRSLQYFIYAMTMDQNEIPSLASIQEKAKSMLSAAGKEFSDNNDLFRKTILLFVSENQEFVLSGNFSSRIKDFEKILAFIQKNRIGASTYSKEKARSRENQVGLGVIEIDRIVSAAKPLLTKINKTECYEKMKKDIVAFDPSSASPTEVDLHARFPDYNPCLLAEFLDTPEKLKAFEEWYKKIHIKTKG